MNEDKAARPMCTKTGFLSGRVVWAAILALFVAAGTSYLSSFDHLTAAWCDEHAEDWSEGSLALSIKQLGKPFVPTALLFFWASLTKRWRAALTVLLAAVLVAPIVLVTKQTVRRPRPYDVADQAEDAPSHRFFRNFSFPSGDTSQAFAMAATLAGFVSLPSRAVLFALAAAVAIQRVLGFHHYPSDVLAGTAVGIACAWCAGRLARRWLPRVPPAWWPRRLGKYWERD